jgi:hypothetical protein
LILKNDAEKKDEKVKQMAFVQLGIGIVLAFATYYATVLDGRQKDRLETLANLNNQLAGHIDTLSLLNDSIATKIKANIDTTQASVNKNVSLSDSINNLTKAIQQLVSLSRDENREGFAKNTISGEFDFRFKKTYHPDDIIYMDYGTMISAEKVSSPAFRAVEARFQRIEINPNYSNGHTYRYATEGWGLIQLYFGGLEENILFHSHFGHFNEAGALKNEGVNKKNGKVNLWDWKAIEQTSRKLKYQIHSKMAIRKIGSYGVLPGAQNISKDGTKLWGE